MARHKSKVEGTGGVFKEHLDRCGSSSAHTPFLNHLVHAQARNLDAPDRYYIFCYFGGGWDVFLSLDPRDPRDFPSRLTACAVRRFSRATDPHVRMLTL